MYTDRNLQRYTHLSATQIHRSTLPLHKHLCTYTPHTHTASCIQLRAWELKVPCLVRCGALGLSPRPHHPGRVLGTEGAACPVLQSAGRYSASKSGFFPALSLPQSPPAPPKPRPPSTQNPQLLHCPVPTHTLGLTPPCPAPAPAPWTLLLLTWLLSGRGGPADLASEQGTQLKFQGARPSSQRTLLPGHS